MAGFAPSQDTPRAPRGLLVLLCLCCWFSIGCGVHVNPTPAKTPTPTPTPQPPTVPPPAQPPPNPSQLGAVTITPIYSALLPGQTEHLAATAQNNAPLQWLVNGIPGGNATVGTVDSSGNYTAPVSLPISTNEVITAAETASPATNFAQALVSVINPGVVTPTANPQVATYSIYLPAPGNISVEFGPTPAYGLPTWVQSTPSANGGQINLYVAGMRGQTPYHMRARINLNDGAALLDSDHTFTTGTPPATASVTAAATNGQTPQPGIELFDTLIPIEKSQAFATDLSGNVIWTYSYPDGTGQDAVQPFKLLPNGHFLVQISYGSSIAVKGGTVLPNTVDAIREVDLAGNTIREVTQAQIDAALTAKGYNLNLGSLHHDVLALPNGHWILLLTVNKSFTNLPGYPGATTVQGDLLVDLDQNNQVGFVWNAFDYLDVNRHPYLFPDWTHSNALLYSSDDGDLLLSMRHQNWILKIDYQNGQGSGKVLWRLGQGGDFKLVGGNDPADWFYAQHGISFGSTNTAGTFDLTVMDNGDDRLLPSGQVTCPPLVSALPPHPASCYSTVPVLRIDEAARTASFVSHYAPAGIYSFFGGNAELLANGNLEANFCAPTGGTQVQELQSPGGTPTLVWQATTPGTYQYRAERMPSLYPGVQW